MSDHPAAIEKRVFTCTSCDYSTQVYGEMYWDHGCHNYMATFMCQNCKVLFENLISMIKMEDMEFKPYHDLAEDFMCLRCGKDNSKVWNKQDSLCPKCGQEMWYEDIGIIRVKF